jgi:hypothetical protein
MASLSLLGARSASDAPFFLGPGSHPVPANRSQAFEIGVEDPSPIRHYRPFFRLLFEVPPFAPRYTLQQSERNDLWTVTTGIEHSPLLSLLFCTS